MSVCVALDTRITASLFNVPRCVCCVCVHVNVQVNAVLSDWGSRLGRVGNKFVRMSNLDVATDAAVKVALPI